MLDKKEIHATLAKKQMWISWDSNLQLQWLTEQKEFNVFTHQSKSSGMTFHILSKWRFFPNLEVKVNHFVWKSREFITETEFENSCLVCFPHKCVILLLGIFIKHLSIRSHNLQVDIIMPTSYYLKNKQIKNIE